MVSCRIYGGILLMFCFLPTLVLIPLGVANMVAPNQSTAVVKSVYSVSEDDPTAVSVAATFVYRGQNATCYVDNATTDITTICINSRNPTLCAATCDSSLAVGIGCVVTGAIWFFMMVIGGVVFSSWTTDVSPSGSNGTGQPDKEPRKEPPMVEVGLDRASQCHKLAIASREEAHEGEVVTVVINP